MFRMKKPRNNQKNSASALRMGKTRLPTIWEQHLSPPTGDSKALWSEKQKKFYPSINDEKSQMKKANCIIQQKQTGHVRANADKQGQLSQLSELNETAAIFPTHY